MTKVNPKPENAYAPDFFIVGAPKCGTTALYAYLNKRADIFMPEVKEPNFYADDLKLQTQVKTQDEYNALFTSTAHEGQTSGEASVWYLLSETAIRNILAINPAAKFIAMVRSPIEMYPSLHAQLVYSLWEDIKDPLDAWNAGHKRQSFTKFCTAPEILNYRKTCALGAQLERFVRDIPESQRLILFQEDLKSDTSGTYKKALAFIGLPPDDRRDFPVINDRKEHASGGFAKTLRSITKTAAPLKRALRKIFPNMSSSVLKPLYDMGSKKTQKADLHAEFKGELLKTFEEDIQKIEKITGRNLSHWRQL